MSGAGDLDPRTTVTPMGRDLLRLVIGPNAPQVIAVNGGVGAGKSYSLAQIAYTVCITRPKARVLMSAGSANLLMAVLYRRCAEVFGDHASWHGNITYPHWSFPNGSTIDFRAYQLPSTRDEADNPWEGRDYALLITDEATSRNAEILTPDGPRTIESLIVNRYRGKVLGFDHATGRQCWTDVLNGAQYGPDHRRRSFRLTFTNGAALEATGNHPIWVDGTGYVAIQNLFDGPPYQADRPEGRGLAHCTNGQYIGVEGELGLVSIEEIEPIVGGCDLTTATANYFANGVLTHNCEQLPTAFLKHSLQRCRLTSRDVSGRVYDPCIVWCGRPGAIDHWVRETERLGSQGMRTRCLFPRTRDNHLLPSSYLQALRASLTLEEFECVTQDRPGATMPLDGAIYSKSFMPTLWPEGNLLDVPVDASLPTRVVVDFGVHTTSVLWVQELPIDGQYAHVVVDEWCPDEPTSIQDVVQTINSRGYNVIQAIVDPAGEQRSRTADLLSEVSILRRPRGHDPDGLGGGIGVPVEATPLVGERRRVKSGVLRTAAAFSSADGTRNLLVRADLWSSPKHVRGVRQTIQQYRWGLDGEPLKGARGHNADHVADTLRLYVVRMCWDGAQLQDQDTPAQRPPRRQPPPPRSAAVTRRAAAGRRAPTHY